MPTPDSLDRGASPAVDQIVFIDPTTKQAVQTTNPATIAQLISQGYERHVVAASDWNTFRTGMGSNFRNLGNEATSIPPIPVGTQRPLSQQELDALNAGVSNTNSSAGAAAENLDKAFGIAQPGRDRAALQTKENYGAAVIPTQAAAAFSGAGYHQANQDLFQKALDRDRTLAGLADQNTSALFQLDVGRQNLEAQRQDQLRQLYADALARSQQQYDQGVNQTLAWIK